MGLLVVVAQHSPTMSGVAGIPVVVASWFAGSKPTTLVGPSHKLSVLAATISLFISIRFIAVEIFIDVNVTLSLRYGNR